MNYKAVLEIDKRDGLVKVVNKSDCCNANLTFVESQLCFIKCFESISWSD